MYTCMYACIYESMHVRMNVYVTFFKGNVVQEVEAYSGACTFLGVHVCMCVCVGLCLL